MNELQMDSSLPHTHTHKKEEEEEEEVNIAAIGVRQFACLRPQE